VLNYLPILAAVFAVPQFLPQLRRLLATSDSAGVSWAWAALTAVNNAAWIAYFALSRYWTALVPSISVTLLASALAVLLTRRAAPSRRELTAIAATASALAASGLIGGRAGLGILLTGVAVVQAAPSIWTAYRTPRPSGVSAGTWTLIFCELLCFFVYGLHESDPRLTVLGGAGIISSTLMLARIRRTVGRRTA
jgi:uncharacterized protein with PQ loop repeat